MNRLIAPYLILPAFLLVFSLQTRAQGAWSDLSSSIVDATGTTYARALARDASGNLYAAMTAGIYKWNGNSWIILGTPNALYSPDCLAIDAQGHIFTAGDFTDANGNWYVAEWTGTTWIELGTGPTALNPAGPINSVTVDKNGQVYAAGYFTNSLSEQYVAKWDGQKWTELGGTGALHANGTIWSVVADTIHGLLYAAGNFTDGNSQPYVAKWDGNNWSEVGSSTNSFANGYILCLTTGANGDVYAGGEFIDANRGTYVAHFDGANWSELGTGAAALNGGGFIRSLAVDAAGNVYAGGDFTLNDINYVAEWTGLTWTPLGTPSANGPIYALQVDPTGNCYIAGGFTNAAGNEYVQVWRPASGQWAALTSGGSGTIGNSGALFLTVDTAGSVYIAGNFFDAAGNRYVAKWDSSRWYELNGNPAYTPKQVTALASDRFGHVYAAGYFATPTVAVAQWTGADWVPVGAPGAFSPNSVVGGLAVDSLGNLYADGAFTDAAGNPYVEKWDGQQWTQIGNTNAYPVIGNIAVDHQGTLYAYVGNGQVAKWNGSTWVPLTGSYAPGLIDFGINFIVADTAGHIYTHAEYTDSYGFSDFVAEWTGSDWRSVGTVNGALADCRFATTDARGTVYFTSDNSVYRWDGTTLHPLLPYNTSSDYSSQLAFDPRGDLFGIGQYVGPGYYYYAAQYDPAYRLPRPLITGIINRCPRDTSTIAQLTNAPYGVSLAITEDGDTLSSTAAATSFVYFTYDSTKPGAHQIIVSYSAAGQTSSADTAFTVLSGYTPALAISGNTTITLPDSALIVAKVTANGDTAYTLQWEDSTATHGWTAMTGDSGSSLYAHPATGDGLRCLLQTTDPCSLVDSLLSNTLYFNVQPAPAPTVNPNGLRVSPDPATTTITLTGLNGQWQRLDVFSSMGNDVLPDIPVSGQNQVTLNIGALAPGYYVIRLSSTTGTSQVRFLKL